MEIGIEDGEIRTVLVEDLIGLHVGMIDRNILVLLEGDAIETVGQAEHAVDDLRQFEIRPQHLRIDIVFLELQLMGIEREVPRLEFLFPQIFMKLLFDFSDFFFRGSLVGGDEVVEELVDVADIAGHTVLHHVVGIGLMAQELCQFATQIDEPLTDLQVVLRIVVDALRILGHIHLPAQVATGAVGHEGRV